MSPVPPAGRASRRRASRRPISSDPPFHHGARRLLLPAFAPQAIDKLEPSTRDYCDELIDAMRGPRRRRRRRRVRPAHPGAGHRPDARLPRGGRRPLPRLRQPRLEGVTLPMEERERRDDHALRVPARRRSTTTSPTRATTSRRTCIDAEMDGQPLEMDHVGGTMALLLIAGIDTTWSAIGASILAPRRPPRRPRAARRRARAAADRDGGAPPGLRAGHHGPPRRARTWTATAAR